MAEEIDVLKIGLEVNDKPALKTLHGFNLALDKTLRKLDVVQKSSLETLSVPSRYDSYRDISSAKLRPGAQRTIKSIRQKNAEQAAWFNYGPGGKFIAAEQAMKNKIGRASFDRIFSAPNAGTRQWLAEGGKISVANSFSASAKKAISSKVKSFDSVSEKQDLALSSKFAKSLEKARVDIAKAKEKEAIASEKARIEQEKADQKAFDTWQKEADLMKRSWMSPIKVIGDSLKNSVVNQFKRLAAPIKEAHNRLERFRKTIGRIVLYRTIRALMSLIKKSVQEGLQNLYHYSQEIGTVFATNMDTIASGALFIKNAFAAMVAPLVNFITPALENIARLVGEAANRAAEFFTILTKGAGAAYTRAIWYMKAFQDTAKNTKKTLDLLGIDEINRLTDPKGSGGEEDYSRMFEEAIAGGEGGFAASIAETIREGDWSEVGRAIAQKMNDTFASIKEKDIASKIGEKINNAISFVSSFLTEVSFSEIATAVTDFLKKLNINWEGVGQAWMAWRTNIFDAIIGLVSDTEWWGKVGTAIGNFFKGALNGLTKWIDQVDWRKLGSDVLNGFITLIQNINLAELLGNIGRFLDSVFSAIAGFFKGLWDQFVEWVQGTVQSASKATPFGGGSGSRTGAGRSATGNANTGSSWSSIKGKTIDTSAMGLEPYVFKKYATGGYVPQGDLFIANEAGPELVGTMNGRTYVGSNSDINSVGIGIENAVYAIGNMVVQAIERKDTTVSLDGDKLSKAVSNRQNLAALARG